MSKNSKVSVEKNEEVAMQAEDSVQVEKAESSTFSLDNFMDIKGLKEAERLFCKRHFKNISEKKTVKQWKVLCKNYGLEL